MSNLIKKLTYLLKQKAPSFCFLAFVVMSVLGICIIAHQCQLTNRFVHPQQQITPHPLIKIDDRLVQEGEEFVVSSSSIFPPESAADIKLKLLKVLDQSIVVEIEADKVRKTINGEIEEIFRKRENPEEVEISTGACIIPYPLYETGLKNPSSQYCFKITKKELYLELSYEEKPLNQILRIIFNSPLADFKLVSGKGQFRSQEEYDIDLLASNNTAYTPYILGAHYEKSDSKETITFALQDARTSQYFVEISTNIETDYELTIETLEGSKKIESKHISGSISATETKAVSIILDPNKPSSFTAGTPVVIPVLGITEELELSGSSDQTTDIEKTLLIKEVSGVEPVKNLTAYVIPSVLRTAAGEGFPRNAIIIEPKTLNIEAGGTGEFRILFDPKYKKPGYGLGALVLRADNGTAYHVRLILKIL